MLWEGRKGSNLRDHSSLSEVRRGRKGTIFSGSRKPKARKEEIRTRRFREESLQEGKSVCYTSGWGKAAYLDRKKWEDTFRT